ncbi:MAG: hypothetical protein ABF449_14465, partial [Ethanoligenens sp.]
MDVMFVNQITLTKEDLSEFYKEFSALSHGTYRTHKIILPTLGVLLILLALFQAFRGHLFI